jgi:hypothetical protein
VITFNDIAAELAGVSYRPLIIISICGAGASWSMGYPYDLGNALVGTGLPFFHQPLGYPAAAFPMAPSVDAGCTEGLRLMREVWAGYDFVVIAYSEGSLVWKAMWDQLSAGEREHVKAAVTFGFPAREGGHTIPGGIDPKGHGIVTPNMVGTPDWWWDFAAGKTMVGSPGQDLYTTCGYDGNLESVADEEAIWEIVDKGNVSSIGGLLKQVLKVFVNPTAGIIAAATAVIDAGMFFVVTNLTPHTSYQFVQPIAGDDRDCWRVALDYLTAVGAKYAGMKGNP